MGSTVIKRKKTVLNSAISILIGLIFGFAFIGLIEESLAVLNYPPLLESWIMWSFGWQGYRIAYYQLVVLVNAAILGLNLGPGFLTILESVGQQWPAPPPQAAAGESFEVQFESLELAFVESPPADGADKLNDLQTLHAQGEINDDEYRMARNKLIHEWRLARQSPR